MVKNTLSLRIIIPCLVLSFLTFSTGLKANPREELVQAVKAKQWHRAKAVLELHPGLSIDDILHFAAKNGGWDLVEFILDRYPNADFNWAPAAHHPTTLWFAAVFGNLDLFKRILDLHPEANLEAFNPFNTVCSTVFWHAVLRAAKKEYTETQREVAVKIVHRMLDLNPNVNVNAGPREGVNRGGTALYIASLSLDSRLFNRMLETPQPDLEAGPVAEDSSRRGDNVIWGIVKRKLWMAFVTALARYPNIDFESRRSEQTATSKPLIKFLENPETPTYVRIAVVLNLWLRQPEEGAQMVDYLTRRYVYGLIDTRDRLIPIFRQVANAFPHFGQQTILETNSFNYFDRNLKWYVALATLRELEPELKNIPDAVLKATLVRFQDAFKGVDYNNRKRDIIEAGVLDAIYPIERRKENNRKTIIKIREWIREAVNQGIDEGIFPADLPAHVRRAIIEGFSRKSPKLLTKIKRQVFMDAVNEMRGMTFVQAQDDEVAANVAEANSRKRSREEQVEYVLAHEPSPVPNLNVREGLVRDVIREAPGLDIAEINARVDELMGENDGRQPMDIDELPPANTNALDVPEVINDFPIDGPMDPDTITQSGVNDKLGLSRRFNG